MKNFQITSVEDGKKYWISRSCAVTGLVIRTDGNPTFLALKRGPGTPDFQGYWCLPCGYIDYDEDVFQAISREVSEETGYDIPASEFKLFGLESDPKANLQNITVRLYTVLDKKPEQYAMGGGEIDEVEEICWITPEDIDKYKWAFGHDEVIKQFIVAVLAKFKSK